MDTRSAFEEANVYQEPNMPREIHDRELDVFVNTISCFVCDHRLAIHSNEGSAWCQQCMAEVGEAGEDPRSVGPCF